MGLFPRKFIVLHLFLLCFAAVSQADKLKPFTVQYGPTNRFNSDSLFVKGSALINTVNNALELTPDTANRDFVHANTFARVLLKQKFKLFHSNIKTNTGRIASFNSSFLINISPIGNNNIGEGLAFIVVPNPDVPAESYGQYLGLTNSSIDGNSSNKFVAIEFDTQHQSFDPPDNHVGLNINSVQSVETVPFSKYNIDLVSMNGNPRYYNIWINYDGANKTLEVYMEEQISMDGPTPMIPNTPLLKSNLDLRGIVDQHSYFGFSASTGNATQLNCVLRWNLTVEYFSAEEVPWLKIALGAGIPVVVMAAACCYWWKRRRMGKGSESRISEGLMRLPGMVREFEYGDLRKATDNFDEKYELGEGGYGVVYRGILQRENLEVAVKLFSRENIKGEEDFLAELTIINRLRHKHLVPLIG